MGLINFWPDWIALDKQTNFKWGIIKTANNADSSLLRRKSPPPENLSKSKLYSNSRIKASDALQNSTKSLLLKLKGQLELSLLDFQILGLLKCMRGLNVTHYNLVLNVYITFNPGLFKGPLEKAEPWRSKYPKFHKQVSLHFSLIIFSYL